MDLKTTIQNGKTSDVIGWDKEKNSYNLYKVHDDIADPEKVRVDFLIVEKDRLPWALTEEAVEALHILLQENFDA